MNNRSRRLSALYLVSAALFVFALPPVGHAQQKGWTLYESFQGSSDSAGLVTKLDSTLGYNFNRYFGVDAGLPVYFIHASDSTSGLTSTNGIGNFYVDLRLTLRNPLVNFSSNLRGTAPTGDEAKGLSTGHATYDWTNYFDRRFGRFTPFAALGVANTVSDTPYYLRPFTSFGLVGHFEAGLRFRASRYLSVSASAYDIAPSGEQTIYSRFMRGGSGSSGGGMGTVMLAAAGRSDGSTGPVGPGGSGGSGGPGSHGRLYELAPVTTGSASLASDNGYSAGVSIFPNRVLDLSVGYSRSVHYRDNSVYFGIGFNVGRIWKSGGRF